MDWLTAANNSKVLWGISTIAMQLGGRHVVGGLTEMQNKFMGMEVVKRFVLCAMIFVATRDIVVSICMTVAIYAALSWLLNENSCLCIVPENMRPPPPLESGGEQQRATMMGSMRRRRCRRPSLVW